MPRQASRKPKSQRQIALERIEKLFSQAEGAFGTKPELAHRYVQLARRIAMRYNLRMPKGLKGRFCKKCYKYLRPGANSTVRTSPRQKAMIIRCLECGNVMRYPYRKEKKYK
jgi:ribonuclease P protein subunit RPR2